MNERPSQVFPFLVAAHSTSSEEFDFHICFPRAFWCSGGKHAWIPHAASRDLIHHRHRFCCDSFFTCIFLCSFRHHFKTSGGTEMAMLNKHNKWFHSWRVKFPFVSLSASWFLVSMYLIWILGSKLILSNNQSRATQWVLETCLLPFMMIILITASLSSNTCNKASWREELTFEEIKSTLSRSSIIP